MTQYKELLAQQKELEKRIEQARRAEAGTALEEVRRIVAEFGFTTQDVFGKPRKAAGKPAAPKYRNPETGDTWGGRGRVPLWLRDTDRESFRVKD